MIQNRDAAPTPAPAFAFYAANMMANRNFRTMTLAQRGLLITLYCECWLNKTVPCDKDILGNLIGKPPQEIELLLQENLLSFFNVNDGEMTSPAMETYRKHLDDIREKKSQGGKKGQQIKKQKIEDSLEKPENIPSRLVEAPLIQYKITQNNLNESLDNDIKFENNETQKWIDDYNKN